MYIVFIGYKRHSAWLTFEKAKVQAKVLRDVGYKHVSISKDSKVQVEDGYYYV